MQTRKIISRIVSISLAFGSIELEKEKESFEYDSQAEDFLLKLKENNCLDNSIQLKLFDAYSYMPPVIDFECIISGKTIINLKPLSPIPLINKKYNNTTLEKKLEKFTTDYFWNRTNNKFNDWYVLQIDDDYGSSEFSVSYKWERKGIIYYSHGKYGTTLPDNLIHKFIDDWNNSLIKKSNNYINSINNKYFTSDIISKIINFFKPL